MDKAAGDNSVSREGVPHSLTVRSDSHLPARIDVDFNQQTKQDRVRVGAYPLTNAVHYCIYVERQSVVHGVYAGSS